MEPFRSIIDRQIVKSHHLKQISDDDFKVVQGKRELSFDQQNKYLEIFANAIMDSKEEIFCYVRDFYYCVMNGADFPVFKIK
jgi:CRISP-associated protein Cas1